MTDRLIDQLAAALRDTRKGWCPGPCHHADCTALRAYDNRNVRRGARVRVTPKAYDATVHEAPGLGHDELVHVTDDAGVRRWVSIHEVEVIEP